MTSCYFSNRKQIAADQNSAEELSRVHDLLPLLRRARRENSCTQVLVTSQELGPATKHSVDPLKLIYINLVVVRKASEACKFRHSIVNCYFAHVVVSTVFGERLE